MPIDLSKLDVAALAEAGTVLAVRHPVTGSPLGSEIRLAGTDSARHRKAAAAIASRHVNASNRAPRINVEDLRREGIELLAKCTLDWSGLLLDGAPVPFSEGKAVELYTRFPWLREQVETFISDRANYLSD